MKIARAVLGSLVVVASLVSSRGGHAQLGKPKLSDIGVEKLALDMTKKASATYSAFNLGPVPSVVVTATCTITSGTPSGAASTAPDCSSISTQTVTLLTNSGPKLQDFPRVALSCNVHETIQMLCRCGGPMTKGKFFITASVRHGLGFSDPNTANNSVRLETNLGDYNKICGPYW